MLFVYKLLLSVQEVAVVAVHLVMVVIVLFLQLLGKVVELVVYQFVLLPQVLVLHNLS